MKLDTRKFLRALHNSSKQFGLYVEAVKSHQRQHVCACTLVCLCVCVCVNMCVCLCEQVCVCERERGNRESLFWYYPWSAVVQGGIS